jgi:hypothetical protein
MTNDEAKALIQSYCFAIDPEEGCPPLLLNLNDVFALAAADAEQVEEHDVERLGELIRRWGWCGVLYWVSTKRGGIRSKFHDINRFINFVAEEEGLIRHMPSSTERAYQKFTYTLGA